MNVKIEVSTKETKYRRFAHHQSSSRLSYRFLGFGVALMVGVFDAFAAAPVQSLTTMTRPATPSSYSVGGQTYRFGLGNDVLLETATVSLEGRSTRLQAVGPDKAVKVRRVEANSTGTNAEDVKGNRLYFQYEGGPEGDGFALQTSQMYSMSEVFASARLNIGAGDLFCNEGIQPNNIERVDFVIESGLVAPGSQEGLGMMGYLVSERLGNNPYALAAITSIDANGDPASFGPLYHADSNDYGGTLYTPEPFYQTVRTPRDSTGPNLLPASYFWVKQTWHGQFNTLEDLGLTPGDTFYGMAMFPADAADDMDLVRLSDVPLDTSDNGFDCGDHFGDTGLLMSAAALGSISGLVWNDLDEDGELDEFESGLTDVTLDLVVDIDGNGAIDDDDRSVATVTTDADGQYNFQHLFPGTYYVVVTDTGTVLEQYNLVSGQSPFSITLAPDEAVSDADFGYRQDVQIGLAKELLAITRVDANVYDVEFRFNLENLDDTIDALNVQLHEDLVGAFPGVDAVELLQAPTLSGGLTRLNNEFDGNSDDGANPNHLNVLAGDETLAGGESASVQLIARVTLGNATGPFENQALMSSSASPGGYILDEDLSDDGASATPSEGGNPSGPGADDPTPVPLVAEPRIGVAKDASEVVVNADGSFSTTFSFQIANLGNTPLYDIQLDDELSANFGQSVADIGGLTGPGTYVVNVSSAAPAGFALNTGYDGGADIGLFNLASDAVLAAGQQIALDMDIRFVPDPAKPSPLYNQAIVSGDLFANRNGIVDADVQDLSDDGLNELSPSSVEENDPTPVPFALTANIGLAKTVAEITTDTYPDLVARFTLKVENLGIQRLANVQVTDDLLSTFPEEAATIVSIDGLQASGDLIPNSAFDGQADKNLLAAGSYIESGSSETIEFAVTFNLKTLDQEFFNQAYVSATTVSGDPSTEDYSDDGTVVDADSDGNPNEEGENDPTPLGIPDIPDVITVIKSASRNEVSIGDVLSYSVRIKNNIPQALDDLEVLDIAPPGFNYKEGTVRLVRAGADNILGTSDDVSGLLVPDITGRADMSFPSFSLAANEWVEIRYVMQVTTGVIAGDYYNRAYIEDNEDIVISNVAAAGVRVVQDPMLQKTTIIGKVFHDRDGDGHQDNGDATGVFIDSPQFVGNQRVLGDLSARVRDSDPLSEHQVQLKAPHHAFTIRTNEGGVFNVSREGDVTTSHTGDVAKGFNNQDLRVEFSHDGLDPLITITNMAVSEEGLPGVRLATVGGLLIETDLYGRYHIADVDTGRDDRSALYIVKVDTATLPEGSVFTTENPRVQRLGKSLMTRFNFGVRLPEFEVATQDVQVPERFAVRETVDLTGLIPDVLFDSGKAILRPDGDRILRATVNTLRGKENIHLNVIGHTDDQRLSQETQYSFGTNYGLGQARADVVAGYLQSHLGLTETNARPYTWGEDQPIASNKNPDGMQQNRRAEVNPRYDETVIKTRWNKRTVRVPHGGVIWATEDPLKLDPRLAVEATGSVMIDDRGDIQPVSFRMYSNYLAYLKAWKIEIFDELDLDQTQPVAVLDGQSFNNADVIEWDASELAGKIRAGDRLNYRLTVFNGEGHFDETYLRNLAVVDQRLSEQRLDRGESLTLSEDRALSASLVLADNQLVRQTIPLNGSRVRLHGADLHRDYEVTINGEQITIDDTHRFVIEQQMPVGEHRFDIDIRDSKGLNWQHQARVDVRGEYLFMVGLANLTIGQNNVSGSVEPLNGDDHYDESTFVDGRAAFYLKGKVKGKYLVTAQLDTTEDELRHLGDNLKAKDPHSLLRSLDADSYYPVYGDDSTTLSDVDSQGAFYVRVDWDKSQALWGNFHSNITGNEFAQYDRTLYGAQLVHRTTSINRWGDHKTQWNVFASEAQTAMGHNRFLATGGSLYYLREQDVVRGSEKLWVEVRERGSERVLETVSLKAGVDYEIDYLQGRILLASPLSQTSYSRVSTSSLVTDQALNDNPVILMADFEYLPDSFSGEEVAAGVRGKHWLNDHVAVGGTYVGEDRNASATDYRMAGLDLTFKGGVGTWLKVEYAESKATQAEGGWLSSNGGLSFNQIQISSNDNREGDAISLEGQINLAELSAGDLKGRIAAWFKDRDDEFSTARSDDGTATTDSGLQVDWDVNNSLRLSLTATSLEKDGSTQERKDEKLSLQARVRTTERLDLIAEVSDVDRRTENIDTGVVSDQEATLAAAGLEYRLNDHASVSVSAQTVVEDNGHYADNDRVTVGLRDQVSDRLALKGELSTGDRGDALQLGADYRVDQQFNVQLEAGVGDAATSEIGSRYYTADGTELYGSYAVSGDRTDLPGESITLGQRKRIGGTEVFVEERFSDNDHEAGVAHVFGIQHQLNQKLALTGGLQHSTVEEADGAEIQRDVASFGVRFKDADVKLSTRLEYREDENDLSDAENTTQWLTANAAEWQVSEHLKWLVRFNFSRTESDLTGDVDAKFIEGDIGLAFRPAFSDRLNLLAKYSHLYDLPSLGQDTIRADEKADVFSFEGLYDLNQRWEVGGKLALRKGQVREDRDGEWFDSGARLALVRTRYHFIKRWDALAEYRVLEAESGDDRKHGGLAGVYRHFGRNLRVGLGYNFTQFDDDLTRLDYDSEGWFIDVVGQF